MSSLSCTAILACDEQSGASLYSSGTSDYEPNPKGTVVSFVMEYDVGQDRAATSVAFLFRTREVAARGLEELKATYRGRGPRSISADHLGQQRWGLSSQFGLPKGFHFGWRVHKVDLVFSYRGATSSPITPAASLDLAETMARRVHC